MIELARDKYNVRLQVAHYNNDTEDSTGIGGGWYYADATSGVVTSAFTANRVVEVTAIGALIWVKVGTSPTATTLQGQAIPQNTWKTFTVKAGEKVSFHGGTVSMVPIED